MGDALDRRATESAMISAVSALPTARLSDAAQADHREGKDAPDAQGARSYAQDWALAKFGTDPREDYNGLWF
jgi:hypothetical protein